MKRTRTRVTVLIMAALVFVAAFPYLRTVVSAQPGDAADPLVTRRYVDERIDEIWYEIQALRTENALLRTLVEAMGTIPGIPGGDIDVDLEALALVVSANVFTDVMFTFEHLYGEMLRTAVAVADAGMLADRAVEFTVLEVPYGSRLTLNNGAELIVRTGGAVVVTETSGLVDTTAGRDVYNNEVVGLNHLMVSPRSDGRGVRFTARSSWVMVRGDFILE